jgi:hypothetical protein
MSDDYDRIVWTLRHETLFVPAGARVALEDGRVLDGPVFLVGPPTLGLKPDPQPNPKENHVVEG